MPSPPPLSQTNMGPGASRVGARPAAGSKGPAKMGAAAVGCDEVCKAVAVEVAVREALAVLVEGCVDAAYLQQNGVLSRSIVLFQAFVVDAGYVEQAGADGDVLECCHCLGFAACARPRGIPDRRVPLPCLAWSRTSRGLDSRRCRSRRRSLRSRSHRRQAL